MKKYKLKKEIMPNSVCGMRLVCTWCVSVANDNCEVVCVCRVHTDEQPPPPLPYFATASMSQNEAEYLKISSFSGTDE